MESNRRFKVLVNFLWGAFFEGDVYEAIEVEEDHALLEDNNYGDTYWVELRHLEEVFDEERTFQKLDSKVILPKDSKLNL